MSYEVEQKFLVQDPEALHQRLIGLGGIPLPTEKHSDTYYNHPCRDFAETQEALRVRRVNGQPFLTYKGTKLPGSVKARRELEWSLAPGDLDGSQTEELWKLLGFREVATVTKTRQGFALAADPSSFTIVIDEVDQLGVFAEIELIVTGPEEVDAARKRILDLSVQLSLNISEPRSYLRMFLGLDRDE
ncbi:MAG: class IV adenylate cyclase [Rubripirellula sp.]|nr:class IV adenylate cyclase [Rubripirellula sp.]